MATDTEYHFATNEHYGAYRSSLHGFTLYINRIHAYSASAQGDCTDAVEWLWQQAYISAQFVAIDQAAIAGDLRETGAWSAEELRDVNENEKRLIWIAACDIRDREDEIEREEN